MARFFDSAHINPCEIQFEPAIHENGYGEIILTMDEKHDPDDDAPHRFVILSLREAKLLFIELEAAVRSAVKDLSE